jgi:hypothetical protein
MNTEWVTMYDGRSIHITGAKRLPRKRKKLVTILYQCLPNDKSREYLVTSPKYIDRVEKQLVEKKSNDRSVSAPSHAQ